MGPARAHNDVVRSFPTSPNEIIASIKASTLLSFHRFASMSRKQTERVILALSLRHPITPISSYGVLRIVSLDPTPPPQQLAATTCPFPGCLLQAWFSNTRLRSHGADKDVVDPVLHHDTLNWLIGTSNVS